MEGERSASSRSRLNCYLAVTPSQGSKLSHPPSGLAVSLVLELYQDCLATGRWIRVVYVACDGKEHLSPTSYHHQPLLPQHHLTSPESTWPVRRGKPGTGGIGRRGWRGGNTAPALSPLSTELPEIQQRRPLPSALYGESTVPTSQSAPSLPLSKPPLPSPSPMASSPKLESPPAKQTRKATK